MNENKNNKNNNKKNDKICKIELCTNEKNNNIFSTEYCNDCYEWLSCGKCHSFENNNCMYVDYKVGLICFTCNNLNVK